MIDLHTHVLPGVDDGAADLAEALDMLAIAQKDGITCLAATPHYHPAISRLPAAEIRRRVEELARAAAERGIAVELVPGAEVHITPGLARDPEALMTLNGSRYLLLELPFHGYPPFVEHVVFELQVRGIVPLLAHCERIVHYQEHLEVLAALVERGCLVQLTGDSLLGHFGARAQAAAEAMLRAGMAHVLASDAHWPRQRPPVLAAARDRVAELVGAEVARELVDTIPRRIIRDQPVEPGRPDLEAARPRRRWRFW
jgi:protein-tyrosine phosphatase